MSIILKLMKKNIFQFPVTNLTSKNTWQKDELSELKTELIPILEKIQEEIFVSCSSNVWKHISISNFLNLNEEELLKKIISNLEYGDFLIQVFDLLDWYPNKIKLYTLMDKPGRESLSALESLKREDLIKIRKSFVDFLSYKEIFDKLKIYFSWILFVRETIFNCQIGLQYQKWEWIWLIIKESLGDFDKFFGYIGKI